MYSPYFEGSRFNVLCVTKEPHALDQQFAIDRPKLDVSQARFPLALASGLLQREFRVQIQLLVMELTLSAQLQLQSSV